MRKSFKRILSLIMAVVMLGTLLMLAPLTVSADTEQAEFLGETVSLDSVIRLNFYVDTKGLNVSYYAQNYDYDERNDGYYDFRCEVEDVEGRPNIQKCSVAVPAKCMSDRISVELSFEDAENNWQEVDRVFSVKEYLEALAENTEAYAPNGKADALRYLCYATLNYGAAAQLQFGHFSDNLPLANENVNYQTPAYGSDELPELTVDEGSQTDFESVGLKYYASSLGLYSDTSYAVCFEDLNLPGNVDVHDNREDKGYSVWGQYVGKKKIGVDSDGYDNYNYMVSYALSGIAAQDLLNDIPVTISYYNNYYDYENGTQIYENAEIKTTFSPRTYIAKVMANKGVHPKYYDYENGGYYNEETDEYEYYPEDMSYEESCLENTVLAIYDYSVRASAYFN